MTVRENFMHSPIFIVSCFIVVLICALGFSRFSQSDEVPYSNKIQPLLVETLGNEPVQGLTNGERYVGVLRRVSEQKGALIFQALLPRY